MKTYKGKATVKLVRRDPITGRFFSLPVDVVAHVKDDDDAVNGVRVVVSVTSKSGTIRTDTGWVESISDAMGHIYIASTFPSDRFPTTSPNRETSLVMDAAEAAFDAAYDALCEG